MTRVAVVFPGQGSQQAGMARSILESSDSARGVFESASRATGLNLVQLCTEGGRSELVPTEVAQPALLTTSIALFAELDRQVDAFAGHSLGEFTALVASGSLDLAQGAALVRRRGEYMSRAVTEGMGAMVAVLGIDAKLVVEACLAEERLVSPANFNSPQQVVISGETDAVRAVVERLESLHERVRTRILRVSAPFHCALMDRAERSFGTDLRKSSIAGSRQPIYSNVTGRPTSIAGEIRSNLERHMTQPVLWQQSIENMAKSDIRLIVEIGPGATLAGLVRRIAPQIVVINLSSAEDVDVVRAAIDIARAQPVHN